MPNAKPLTPSQITWLRKNAHLTGRELAAHLNCSAPHVYTVMKRLGIPHPDPQVKPWTAKQAAWIRANLKMPRREMAERLGCSVALVQQRLKKMGLVRQEPYWTPEEDARLRSLAGTMMIVDLSQTIQRSMYAVKDRAKFLKLDLRFNRFWPPADDHQLRYLVSQGVNTNNIAVQMDHSAPAIRERMRKLGIKRDKPLRWGPSKAKRTRKVIAKLRSPRLVADHAKAPQPKPEPRERIGIPVASRRGGTIHGSVAWCERCCSPVVDTPRHWADHNQRVHVEPLRRIA